MSGHCSGTLFTSGYVITAGHCLYHNDEMSARYTGYNIEHEQLWFAADESFSSNQGSDIASAYAPYGYLRVVRSWVPQCWADADDGCDFGVAEVEPYSDGSYVGSYTGTFPLMWGYDVNIGQQFYLFGYPASNGFEEAQYGYGDKPYYCDDRYDGGYQFMDSGTLLASHECIMTGGASGGPVFVHDSNGSWYVGGVVNRALEQNATGNITRQESLVLVNYWWPNKFGAFLCNNFPSACN